MVQERHIQHLKGNAFQHTAIGRIEQQKHSSRMSDNADEVFIINERNTPRSFTSTKTKGHHFSERPRYRPRTSLFPRALLRKWPLAIIALTFLVLLVVLQFFAARFAHDISALFAGYTCVEFDDHVDCKYFSPYACTTRKTRTESITKLLRTLTTMLDAADVDYWLDSGTLLGQFRHQGVISYDDDADIGILHSGYERLRDEKWDIPPGYELQVYESALYDSGDRDWNIPARLVDTNYGFYIDIFVFTESTVNGVELLSTTPSRSWALCEKCLSIGARRSYNKLLLIPKSYVYPLLSCPFADFTALCPAQRTQYLEHLYGNDFRVAKMSSLWFW